MASQVTTPPESSVVEMAGVASNHSFAAFLELVNDIEPHVDEVTHQPIFHCFTNLPIELRYEIYELYFDRNRERALATQNWPRYRFSAEELHRRDSAKFLPDLCMASKSCTKEVGSLLLTSLEFQFEDVQQAMQFTDKAVQFQSPELNIVQSILGLNQLNVNDCSKAHLYILGTRVLTPIHQKSVELSNGFINIALNMF